MASPPHASRACSFLFLALGAAGSLGELGSNLRHESHELREALGFRSSDDGKLNDVERSLSAMYATLPKNVGGGVGRATVRYALHRFFTERHGWVIAGLEPAGGSWNGSSPASVMQGRAPSHLQDSLERRMDGAGLSLRELAMLASALERLAHEQTLGWLEAAYRATGVSLTGRASEEEVARAIHLDVAAFIAGDDLPTLRPKQTKELQSSIESLYPAWGETQQWLEDVRRSVAYERRASANPFVGGALGFESAAQTMEAINDRYGRFQVAECAEMKNALLSLQDVGGTGRVSLARFYGGASAGADWRFSESVNYLRQLGALDETVPEKPSVIVANYVNGPNNCVASLGLHTVCCISECEALLGELERDILAPTAPPERIASVASQISSPTVDAPRNLSEALLGRLQEVADHHGGAVPLHGRLFAQWMHHAFPLECPYPHVSGSTAPRTPEAWMKETRRAIDATKEERAQHALAAAARRAAVEAEEPLLQWSMEEELVAYHQDRASTTHVGGQGAWLRRALGLPPCVVLGAAALSAVVGSLRLAGALPGQKRADRVPQRFSV